MHQKSLSEIQVVALSLLAINIKKPQTSTDSLTTLDVLYHIIMLVSS
jgi:hypothetical protein